MGGIVSDDVSDACKRSEKVFFWTAFHGVCDPCQTYFTTPRRMVWRISTGVSMDASKPAKRQ